MAKKEGFVKGAVVGGLVGSAVGLLLAPKSGKELRCDISDTYCNISEKGHELKNAISEKGHAIKEKIRGSAEDVRESLSEEEDSNEFFVGSVIGALVGATAAVLLAPKAGKEMRRDIEKAYDAVKDRAEDFRDNVKENVSDLAKRGQKAAGTSMDDFIELAQVGLKAWNNLQRRR